MANVRDSDTSLWLHNKLGTSNDSWTGGSICSQLNAEVLRNIKDCFPDLQTQVKLKLLLSFFHIPPRNVDEWKVELEEILEVALVDSDQWVSMLAEIIKTFPATGSLNTDISEVDENRRIFSDLVNDLKKLVRKHCDLGMLPLECHYLNKSALVSVVGQQPQPTKHFTLKRKPKSAALRAELLQKSADAASSLKKSTAPTVPVRSRGMPRKMTDTTPLKGIPSKVPTGGFRSPVVSPLSRPLPRTPVGHKDRGIKLLDINEQPLGYAQAKKRKRMQEMEEAKKASEAQAGQASTTSPASAAGGSIEVTSPTTSPTATGRGQQSGATPDYAVGLTATNPPTPAPPPASYAPPSTPQPILPATPSSSTPDDSSATPSTTTEASVKTEASTPGTPTTTRIVGGVLESGQPSYVPQVTTVTLQVPKAAPGQQQPQRVLLATPVGMVGAGGLQKVAPGTVVGTVLARAAPGGAMNSATVTGILSPTGAGGQMQLIQLKPNQQLAQICIQQPSNQTQVVQLATTVPPTGVTATNVIVTGTTTVPVSQTTVVAAPTTVGGQAATTQRKSLALSREQILEAQDMFRNANKVTRPEKALILGFMAGSRDNPCPHLGKIVTIKLSENQENVQQPDNTYLTMMVETHFQMNYNTGEWKRIKKCRKLEEEAPA
ncbi:negative elongation factor A [Ischnura elegans]|uniref:negative elongation factor A n=1 Tax=Ischnura elegans TaxID=197161 RepID=UPI001ED8ADAA|nr:negative elongation factor A [Ischnura elegans]